jgi:hypothetical protein
MVRPAGKDRDPRFTDAAVKLGVPLIAPGGARSFRLRTVMAITALRRLRLHERGDVASTRPI